MHDRLAQEAASSFTLRMPLTNEVLPLQYGLRSGSLPKSGFRGS